MEAVDHLPLSPNGKAQLKDVVDIIAAASEARKGRPDTNTTSSLEPKAFTDSTATEEDEGKLANVLRAATEVLRPPGEKLGGIRAEDTFIGAGGSSLLALKLVSALRRLNLSVSARDIFGCRKFSDIAQIASTTATSGVRNPGKSSGAAQILADLRAQARRALRLAADENIDAGPLTSLQLELAMPTLADASKNVNQLKLVYVNVHADMMERAWHAAWQWEPVFRTDICLGVGCGGAQVIHQKAPRRKGLKHEVYHSRQAYETAVGASSMAVGLSCRLELLAYRPSETARGTDEDELTIILTVHHSLMDGSSLRVLLDRVERTAHGWSIAGSPSPVHANLALIGTQRSRDAEAKAFFAKYLKDLLPPPKQNSVAVSGHHPTISKTVLLETSVDIDELTAFASKHCVSAACVYYTAWAMAISILERTPHVVVGAVFSSREALQPEHEEAVGLYMSTLPLVFRFDDAHETVVAKLQHTMRDLAMVGDYAWARSDQVGLGRRLRNLLSMQLPLPDKHSRPPAARVESVENLDFPLSMLVEGDGSLRILYDETEFDKKAICRAGEHFKHALWCLLRETRVGDCLRIGRLHETLLEQAYPARLETREGMTVKKALEDAMGRFAELPALEDCPGTTVLSYGDLDKLTSLVAHGVNESLSSCDGVENNNKAIAVYGDGTAGWVLGVLGVVRSGRTFVSLDPKWPADRVAAVCGESGATGLMIVPSAAQVCEAPAIPGMRVLAVDSILSNSRCANSNNDKNLPVLDDTSSPDSDLFVVFTSGTTGAPKGVPVSNRGFLALQSNIEATMFAAPGRRIAQFMSPAFDVCNAEIFSALLHGATLVLRDPLDPLAHLARVNTATITPSVLAILDLDKFPGLETVRTLPTA
jgi:non-ribosomal peptide synthetase component F